MKILKAIFIFFISIITWRCNTMELKQALKTKDKSINYTLEKFEEQYGAKFIFSPNHNIFLEKNSYETTVFSCHLEIEGEHFDSFENPNEYKVYFDDTGLFKECVHIHFYKERILQDIRTHIDNSPLKDLKYSVRLYPLDRKFGKWSGKEPYEQYLEQRDFQTSFEVYLDERQTKDEYVLMIHNILDELYEEKYFNFNINLHIKVPGIKTYNKDDIFYQDLDQFPNLVKEWWTNERIKDSITMY